MTSRYREVEARSITRLPGRADPWFLGRYGMNLCRGCEHGCSYCDGRAERYHVEGDFEADIAVERNAVEVLGRELARVREPGFVLLGGGVCDAYQPAEEGYRLARGALELALHHGLPVHVVTKSALVERDLDLLARLAEAATDGSLLAVRGVTREEIDLMPPVLTYGTYWGFRRDERPDVQRRAALLPDPDRVELQLQQLVGRLHGQA